MPGLTRAPMSPPAFDRRHFAQLALIDTRIGTMNLLEWTCAAIVLFSFGLAWFVYAFYPVLIWALSRVFGRAPVAPPIETADLPSVTLLIAAHNEARDIGARIQNALTLHYPRDRFEILIVSDGSTDD